MNVSITSKRLLIFTASIQIAFLGSVCLDMLGLELPLLRQVTGFLYLIFIPGFLILKIIRLNNMDIIDTLLYSAGLSLSFLMFTGALINYLYPIIGILKPISETPLIITTNVLVLLLCFVVYLRGKKYPTSFSINTEQIFSPTVLSLCLLPFLAIFGTYLLNFYDNNILLLILIATISIMPVLVAFGKIPEETYPLAILATSFVLLSYNNLLGGYIRPTDAVYEFYFAKLVIENGFWDRTISGPLNGMLSVVMLPPIFSKVLNMSLTWVYKIIAPSLSLLIPLGLYKIYQRRWNKKISFFASFLFLSMFTFYTWCAVTMKMLFAGIFLTLLILTMTNKEINYMKKQIIFVIFCLSLITSHYGTSYIFMFSLFVSVIILYLFKALRLSTERSLVTPTIIALFSVSTFVWYTFTSAVSSLDSAIGYLSHVVKCVHEFIIPSSTEVLIAGEWSTTIQILKLLYLVVAFFMFVGLLFELYESKHIDEYASLSIPFLSSLVFVYLAPRLYPGRIWFIVSILLAPYCIEGMSIFSNFLVEIVKESLKRYSRKVKYTHFLFIKPNSNVNRNQKLGFVVISTFLLIFLLFNSGFTSEVIFKDYGPSIYLSKARIQEQGNIIEKERFFRKYITDYDVFSAKWLSKNKDTTIKKIYCDRRGKDILNSYGNISPLMPVSFLTNRTTNILSPSYVYLKYVNVVVGIMGMHASPDFPLFKFNNSTIYLILLKNGNKIYSNRGSEIYYFF